MAPTKTESVSNSNITSVDLINPFGDIIIFVFHINWKYSHSFNPCKHDIVIDIRYLVNTEIYENIFLCADCW